MPTAPKCSHRDCNRPARMAVSTIRSAKTRGMKSIVHYDNREAPGNATRYCKEHGINVVTGLVDTLTDLDEEIPDDTVTES